MSRTSRVSACIKIVAALGAICLAASAARSQEAASSAGSLAELEAVVWNCDRMAAQDLVDVGTAALCSKATEEFRIARFGGDFNALYAWWQRKKASDAGRATREKVESRDAAREG